MSIAVSNSAHPEGARAHPGHAERAGPDQLPTSSAVEASNRAHRTP